MRLRKGENGMAKPEAPVLETERLILRRRQPRDVPRMLQAYQDEKIRRYLGGYPPKDSASLTQLVRRRTPVEWAITLRGEDLYIGECTINRVVDGYLGELGYLLLREYWGRGYASEAARAVLDYAADRLRLGRMYALIDAANAHSIRLAERLGFERVAFLPEANFGGRVADMVYYSRKLPGREWPQVP